MRFIAFIYIIYVCIYVHSLTKQNLQTLRRMVDRINMRPPMQPGRIASFARFASSYFDRASRIHLTKTDWQSAVQQTGEKFTGLMANRAR